MFIKRFEQYLKPEQITFIQYVSYFCDRHHLKGGKIHFGSQFLGTEVHYLKEGKVVGAAQSVIVEDLEHGWGAPWWAKN